MKVLLAIFIGGGLGSLTRYGVSMLVTSNFKHINPVATLTSNITSTIILGVVLFFGVDKFVLSTTMKALIVIGFCGGFSTFSTFSYETFELIKTGNYVFAGLNLLASITLVIGVLFILARSL